MAGSKPGHNTRGRDAKADRRGLTQALAEPVRRVARDAAGTRSLGEASLLTDWRSIVGDAIADLCWPRRITFPKRNERREGTLVLRVKPGQAPRVGHQEYLILERVNAYFGYKVAAGMRLEHGRLPANREPLRRRRPLPAPGPGADDELAETLAPVGDDALRDALARLGQSLHSSDGGRDGS